ncbi:TFIIS central domain-containing protein, partial [Balamuthia mandrillaris]
KDRTTAEEGKEEEREEGLEEVLMEVVLPEEVKERLERLQRRCDACALLFLQAEAEEEETEEKEGEGREQGRERAVRRCWDEERRVWWELLCCSQSCLHRPLSACSLASK